MKLVSTLVKHFQGYSFRPGLMYFQYNTSLYPILGITETSVKYGSPGEKRSSGALSGNTSYRVMSIDIKNSLRGPRIVFRIDS